MNPHTHAHVQRLQVTLGDQSVGMLAMAPKGAIVFEYSADWIAHGFDIAPKSLAFNTQPQLAKSPLFGGLHGVFNDSLPDGWGLLLMDRALGQRMGWARQHITPLDRLAYMGTRAMGALGYAPEMDTAPIEDTVNLAQLAASVEQVLAGDTAEVLAQLRIQGGSPGGARPKVTVALSDTPDTHNTLDACLSGFNDLPAGYAHWIVKFRSAQDPIDMGRAEKAYADMAGLAGVHMPNTALRQVQVGSSTEDFFSVRRFDRDANLRHHVITMAGLYYADFKTPCMDYRDLLGATSLITRDVRQVERAFRWMVFNVLAHNKDDHAKNFAFIHTLQSWQLSPAYDLTFSHGMGQEHTTAVLGHGNPGPQEMLQLAANFQIPHAAEIIAQTVDAVAHWPELARANGVGRALTNEIQSALAIIAQRFI
ncbi:MAG: hypothetical protein RLZ68_85 [Pseudomonadota bacterium]|jgi:serine/threonine-protein kinase HipA